MTSFIYLRQLYALVGITFALQVYGQNPYQPLVTQTKSWTIKTCFAGICTYDGYYILGDTLAFGKRYTYLNGYHYNRKFLLREDSSAQKVFLLVNIAGSVEEYLLYDFSLLPGDSIYLENPVSPAINGEGFYSVDSIVLKSFLGASRRFFYLSANDSNNFHQRAEWIEGIGSTAMINTPGVAGNSVKIAELTCVIENGHQIYRRRPQDSCAIAANIGVVNWNHRFGKMWFDGNTLHLQNATQPGGSLFIVDNRGSLAKEIPLNQGRREIKLAGLPPGIYLAYFQSRERRGPTIKILISK